MLMPDTENSKNVANVAKLPIKQAVKVLKNGGLIAYPTEGVFGIGCDPLQLSALQRVIEIKQRDASKGLIIVSAEFSHLENFIEPLDLLTRERLLATWPGAVTWIVRAKPTLPELLTGGRETIAVRVSQHPVIVSLSQEFGGPIVSTSANYSGQPACTTATAVRQALGEKIDLLLDAPVGGQQGATPIFDAASGNRLR